MTGPTYVPFRVRILDSAGVCGVVEGLGGGINSFTLACLGVVLFGVGALRFFYGIVLLVQIFLSSAGPIGEADHA